MDLHTKLLTNDEFFEFVNLPENAAKDYELLDGVLYEMPSPSLLHNVIAAKIARLLGNMIEPLGWVVLELDFALAPGIVMRPDVAFILKENLVEFPVHPDFAPDLAVEIMWPSNTSIEITTKIETYFTYGTRLVWVVYPIEKVVRIYQRTTDAGIVFHKRSVEDTLEGGDVLPGLSIAVRDIFPDVKLKQ